MTPPEAIAFLLAHQPMPDDVELTEDVIESFDEARRILALHRDPRAVPLLLNAFGNGDGFGVYQLVEDTLREYPRDAVVEALAVSLRSDVPSVRSWSMEIALEYSDERLLATAGELVTFGDRDTRFFAAAFLADFDGHRAFVEEALQRALGQEIDPEIRAIIQDRLSQ